MKNFENVRKKYIMKSANLKKNLYCTREDAQRYKPQLKVKKKMGAKRPKRL